MSSTKRDAAGLYRKFRHSLKEKHQNHVRVRDPDGTERWIIEVCDNSDLDNEEDDHSYAQSETSEARSEGYTDYTPETTPERSLGTYSMVKVPNNHYMTRIHRELGLPEKNLFAFDDRPVETASEMETETERYDSDVTEQSVYQPMPAQSRMNEKEQPRRVLNERKKSADRYKEPVRRPISNEWKESAERYEQPHRQVSNERKRSSNKYEREPPRAKVSNKRKKSMVRFESDPREQIDTEAETEVEEVVNGNEDAAAEVTRRTSLLTDPLNIDNWLRASQEWWVSVAVLLLFLYYSGRDEEGGRRPSAVFQRRGLEEGGILGWDDVRGMV
ncbi:hypothetical protein RUND412_000304 [Rhizina undulata]